MRTLRPGFARLRRLLLAIFPLLGTACLETVQAQEATCERAAFEAAVSDAAAALRQLSASNRPVFQARLQALRSKRGWSQDRLLSEAAPIVQDQQTDTFDRQSADLLADIQRMGAEGSAAPKPDCSALTRLRERMQALVTTQQAKWAYLIDKVDRELKP